MFATRLADYWPEPASGLREFPKFEEHYAKHAMNSTEWPAPISRADYTHAADEFIEGALNNPRIQWFAETTGSVTIYDAQTNELAVLRRDGAIVTYYRPRRRQAHYTHALRTQMDAGFVVDWGGPTH